MHTSTSEGETAARPRAIKGGLRHAAAGPLLISDMKLEAPSEAESLRIRENALDQALEESFPASDPVASTRRA